MRNRALHDALRKFALEAAALLSDDQKAGAELEFDLAEEGPGRGPSLYHYTPLIEKFIGERWHRLRQLPTCPAAAEALGAGAAAYLRVNGLRGEQAEPALQAMLERLYEDATSFGFPEERFERVYDEVEGTLFDETVRSMVLAPVHGLVLESDRVELGDGLYLARGERADAPPEAVWPEDGGEPSAVCVLERDVAPDAPLAVAEVHERFHRLVTALRLFKAGGVSMGAVGWRCAPGGRRLAFELGEGGAARGEPWVLESAEEEELRDFLSALDEAAPGGRVSFALARFEMGCSRPIDAEALSDYLLGLRALLDATTDAGQASLGLRLAALCAEDGERRTVRRQMEAALALERYVMGGADAKGQLEEWIGAESPRALVIEMERHLRALLRDVLCGYLESDLRGLADDILLESSEPIEIQARDLRVERDTSEIEAVRERPAPKAQPAEWRPTEGPPVEPEPEPEPIPEQPELEGVTPSADWGPPDEDPDSYSAPV
jgi:hypothetical protein